MGRTYSAPIFNLTANIWRQELGSDPTLWAITGPARAADVVTPAQLYLVAKVGSERFVHSTVGGTFFPGGSIREQLRVPAGTLISFPIFFDPSDSRFDVVEVPAGSGYYYVVSLVLDAHKGFANEYRVCDLTPYLRIGTPEDADRREPLDCTVAVDGDLGP